MNPLLALIVLAAVIALAAVVAWPDRGWLWRWRSGGRVLHRTRTEDALKHLFDCEYQGRQATHQSLVGVLRLGGGAAPSSSPAWSGWASSCRPKEGFA